MHCTLYAIPDTVCTSKVIVMKFSFSNPKVCAAFDDSSTYSNLKGRVFFEDVADLGNAKGKEDLTLF